MLAIKNVVKIFCLCGLFTLFLTHVSLAQDKEKTEISIAEDLADNTPLLEIQIETTRSQMEVGLGMGVAARLKNNSNSTLYICERYLTLIIPAEIEFKRWHLGRAAFFSTEWDDRQDNSVVALLPGDSYRVFWTVSEAEEWEYGPIKALLMRVYHSFAFLFFSPGDYDLAVNGKYWTTPDLNEEYHTVTTSSRVSITAPQVIILFGAGLGGLIAFFLMPVLKHRRRPNREIDTKKTVNKKQEKWWQSMLKSFPVALGTILLSVVVTILLSRISDTQFFIQVTVNDFWGAIAIGFIGAVGGKRFLDWIIRGGDKNAGKTNENAKLSNNSS